MADNIFPPTPSAQPFGANATVASLPSAGTPTTQESSATEQPVGDLTGDGVVDEKDKIIDVLQKAIKDIIGTKRKVKATQSQAPVAPFSEDQLAKDSALLDPRFDSPTPPFIK